MYIFSYLQATMSGKLEEIEAAYQQLQQCNKAQLEEIERKNNQLKHLQVQLYYYGDRTTCIYMDR